MDAFFLLQEHDMSFDKIIADSVNDGLKAMTENISWKKLGFNYYLIITIIIPIYQYI